MKYSIGQLNFNKKKKYQNSLIYIGKQKTINPLKSKTLNKNSTNK